jgi:O-antigen ligase
MTSAVQSQSVHRPAVDIHYVSHARGRLIVAVGNGLLYMSVLLSWIVFFEPAPTDVLFAASFLALTMSGQLAFPRDAKWLHLGVLGFVIANIISGTVATDPLQMAKAVATNLYMLTLLYLFMSYVVRNGLDGYERIANLFFWASAISAALGLAAYFRLLPGSDLFFRSEYGIRLKGLFKDPNVFGPYLVAGLILGISMSLDQRKISLVHFLCYLLLVMTTLVTFSRGAWVNLAFAGALFGLLIFLFSPNRSQRITLLAFALFGFPIIGLVGFALLRHFDLLDYIVLRARFQSYDSDRWDTQAKAIAMAIENPLGIGPGHYVGAKHFANSKIYLASHNGFLKVLIENGWLGFTSFCLILLSFFAGCIRTMWRYRHLRILMSGLIAVVCGSLVNSLVIDSLHWRHLFVILGLGFGLSCSVVGRESQPDRTGVA